MKANNRLFASAISPVIEHSQESDNTKAKDGSSKKKIRIVNKRVGKLCKSKKFPLFYFLKNLIFLDKFQRRKFGPIQPEIPKAIYRKDKNKPTIEVKDLE